MSKREEIWTAAPEKQPHIKRASLKARASVNKNFRGGDKRPRNERYNGGSKLGIKLFGGGASTDEYRDGYARIFGK